MNKKKIVIASQSQHKLKEISSFLATHSKIKNNYEFLSLKYFSDKQADENGSSFKENALIKAIYASKVSGLPSLSDDSGLCVEALNNEPGIYSSRYAQMHTNSDENSPTNDLQNNQLLIKKLSSYPNPKQRKAYFVCVLVLLNSHLDSSPVIIEAKLNGFILNEPRGENGFGYDPLFYIPELNKTLAELTLDEKNKISHRANALIQLKSSLISSL